MPQDTYIERTESALVETIALEELASNTEMKRDEVVQRVRDFAGFDEKVDERMINDCLDRLVNGGHLERAGDNLRITDDGKEDVRKIERMMQQIRPARR